MKKKQMDIVTKMTIIGILGLVCITAVVLAVSLMNKPKKASKPVDTKDSVEVINQDDQNGKKIVYGRAMAVVKKVDSSNNKLIVLDVESEEILTLAIDGAVDLKDEYGSLLTLIQLNMGDLVETKYDKDTYRPEYVHKTAKNWERKGITGVTVDPSTKTLTIGNDQYDYTAELVSIFNGEIMDIATLNPEDKVTLRGYRDKVWTVIMESGHGYITLKNHSYFVGGTLEIGVSKMADIEETTSVVVPVGVHDIILTKDKQTYAAEVMVANGQEVIVDVKDASPRVGMVQFKVEQEGIQFAIGEKVFADFSEPVELEFGTYMIKVVKDNYVDWEKILIVDKDFTEFEINLEKKPLFLHVNTPQGVEIYIDSNYAGQIPISVPIDPGTYRITLRQDGYYSKMHTITIEDDGEDKHRVFPKLKKIEETSQPGNGGGQSTPTPTPTTQPSVDDSSVQETPPTHTETDTPVEDDLEDTSGAESNTPANDNYKNEQ